MELAGPAGAGKTTLARALADAGAGGEYLAVWGLPRRALLARAAALVPAALGALGGGHALGADELAQMARVDALWRIVDRARRARGGVVVLDEGPVFALSWFAVQHGRNGDPGWAGWRRRAVVAWARCLDAVVYVDAADAVLTERIRTRAKPHPVKDASDGAIADFTARFRAAFAHVLDELHAAGGMPVLRLREDVAAPRQAAIRLHAALEDLRHAR